MAAYPSIGMRVQVAPLNERRIDVSDSGKVRSVSLGETTAYRFRITHPLITSSEVTTLRNFYAANGNTVNTITVDGITYNVQFQSAYQFESESATYWNASVNLVGTPQ